jgi:hypothetical protein
MMINQLGRKARLAARLPAYGVQANLNKYYEKVKKTHVIMIGTTTYIVLEHNTRERQHHK